MRFYLALMLIVISKPLFSCTPIPYLSELFSSSTIWNFSIFARTHSEWINGNLGSAIVPYVVGLGPILLIILLKTFFTKRYAAPDNSWGILIFWIFLANVFSSLPAIVFILFYAAPFVFPVVFVIILCILLRPAKLLNEAYFGTDKSTASLILFAMAGTLFLTTYLLFMAKSQLMGSTGAATNYYWYWTFKIAFCLLSVGTGLFITTAMESRVLYSPLGSLDKKESLFFKKLLKANLYSLLVFFIIAALLALPLRFMSPDFLI